MAEALAHIEAEAGRHFDPDLAAVFAALVRAQPGATHRTLAEA